MAVRCSTGANASWRRPLGLWVGLSAVISSGCASSRPAALSTGDRTRVGDLRTVLGVIEVVVPVDRLAEGLDALRGIGGLRHDGIQDSTGIDGALGRRSAA